MNLVRISSLRPGDRFRTDEGTTGTLLYVNFCRACVELDAPGRQVTVRDRETGTPRTFTTGKKKRTSWAPEALVEKLDAPRRVCCVAKVRGGKAVGQCEQAPVGWCPTCQGYRCKVHGKRGWCQVCGATKLAKGPEAQEGGK